MQELDAWRLAHQEVQRLRHLITLAQHTDTAHLVPHSIDELRAQLEAALQVAQSALDQASRSLRSIGP